MNYFVALAATILLLVLGAVPAGAAQSSQESLRVAILKGGESVRLDGSGLLVVLDGGEPYGGSFPLNVKRSGRGLSAGGRGCVKVVASASGPLLVNGKPYRGVVEITPADGGMLVINELHVEEYLVGLINCEISSQWPMEAVKAQAVIARTYALYQKEARRGAPYHLESTVLDQVYEGCLIEDSRALRGVRDTEGEVLTWRGEVIQAFFHSSCGGHTESSENVWGFPLPYVAGVDCRYCILAPSVRWELTLPLRRIETALKGAGITVSGLKGIKAGSRNVSGRLVDIMLVASGGPQAVPAVKFRQALGYGVIRSTNFTLRVEGSEVTFRGLGYGHGVGLCQWGAKARATEGFDYREILAYYYPGTVLEKRISTRP